MRARETTLVNKSETTVGKVGAVVEKAGDGEKD